MFRFCKNLDETHCGNFQLKIRRIQHDLIIKLITRMDEKSRDEFIKPNQSVIMVVYYSMIVSNHSPIRLKRFISKLDSGVME